MKRLSRPDVLILFLLGGLFMYVVARIILVNITNDEAYSFYTMKNFWYAEVLCTGNTHWLNSLAIKTAILLHREEVWQLRWLSLLSALIFFMVVFQFIRTIQNSYFKLLFFSLLVLNPYVLDYFGLARGYAPGLMMEMLCLFCFYRATTGAPQRFYFFALLCAGLAALANFSFVYFFMAVALLYFAKLYFRKMQETLRSAAFYRDLLFVAVITFLVLRAFIFISRCSNDVVGAGTNDFSEFPMVFLEGLLYEQSMNPVTLKFLSPTLLMGLVLSGLAGLLGKKAADDKLYFLASQLLLLMLLMIGILYLCFQVVLPFYRSALFLFPASAICLAGLIGKMADTEFLKKVIPAALALLLTLNFFFSANVKFVFDYYQQANLEECFDLLEQQGAKHVGMSRELYGCFRNYYQAKTKKGYHFKGELISEELNSGTDPIQTPLKRFDYLVLMPPYNLSNYAAGEAKLKALRLFKESGALVVKVEER